MPGKNEIERRKKITRERRLKATQDFDNSLPMSRENFTALFNNLDEQLATNGCNHSLTLAINFLHSLQVKNTDEITEWLKENGGYCDCEVLANIEEKFDDNAML